MITKDVVMYNSWFEKEEDELCQAYNRGEISLEEFNNEMRELRYQLQAIAEEEAQAAYDNVMNGYY